MSDDGGNQRGEISVELLNDQMSLLDAYIGDRGTEINKK